MLRMRHTQHPLSQQRKAILPPNFFAHDIFLPHDQIENALKRGKLVPKDVIFGLLSKKLEEGYNKGENGFILEAFPRTRRKAVTFTLILVDCLSIVNKT
ncbi:hypothetical protein Ancab_002667 [Ancistrocladus abbreviatus]